MPKKSAFVVWFTGLSGTGKTTLAKLLVPLFTKDSLEVEHIDGDELRDLFPEVGFARSDRELHIKRVAHTASLLEKHNVVTITSLISPYESSRNFAKSICKNFFEIYLSTPLEVCEKRDPKGLYLKARSGVIKNFTGIGDVYEIPKTPFLNLNTEIGNPEELAITIYQKISLEIGRV